MANSIPASAVGLPRCSILAICSTYPPIVGGTEVEMQRVCSALSSNGHSIKVLSAGGYPMPAKKEWVDPYGVPVRLYGAWCPARWRQYVYALGVAWTLVRERRHLQIVYFVMGGIQLAVALPVARILGQRIVMKFAGSDNIAPLTTSRLGRFELYLLRRWSVRTLVLNPAMVEEAVSAGLRRGQIAWMPNPVDVDTFTPVSTAVRRSLRRARQLPVDAHLVVFVGRLAPEKQLPSLLEAFAEVVADRPNVHLALVGDGPLRLPLQELAADLGISTHVRFAGAIPPEEVSGWLQSADVFTLVSSREGFPCSLLEAMAVGLPAVVSDIAGNRQLIQDGVNGFVAPGGDRRSMARAFLRLIENADLRANFGTASRQLVVDNYSIGRVTDMYELLFGELLSGSARAER